MRRCAPVNHQRTLSLPSSVPVSIASASTCAVIPVPAGSPVEKPPGGGGALRSNIGADGVVGPTICKVLLDVDGVVLVVTTSESSFSTADA